MNVQGGLVGDGLAALLPTESFDLIGFFGGDCYLFLVVTLVLFFLGGRHQEIYHERDLGKSFWPDLWIGLGFVSSQWSDRMCSASRPYYMNLHDIICTSFMFLAIVLGHAT